MERSVSHYLVQYIFILCCAAGVEWLPVSFHSFFLTYLILKHRRSLLRWTLSHTIAGRNGIRIDSNVIIHCHIFCHLQDSKWQSPHRCTKKTTDIIDNRSHANNGVVSLELVFVARGMPRETRTEPYWGKNLVRPSVTEKNFH